MKNKNYVYGAMVLSMVASLALAVPAFAQSVAVTASTSATGTWTGKMHGGMRPMMKPGVFGTVSAISGNTITVSGKSGFGANANATTFSVDATDAKVMKAGAVSTVSAITVGDTIMAQGTLTGTNLVATNIRDGVMRMGNGAGMGNMGNTKSGQSMTSPITGNGEPVVAGSVTAVSGNTLTITNKSNVTYTVDATNAKITGGSSVTSISNVTVGDMVVVQGTVNGNAVVATSVIDQKAPTGGTISNQPKNEGFFAGIGSFFSHIFGF